MADDGNGYGYEEEQPPERGCGRRQKGGVYLEVGLSDHGYPIEHFLLDPPVPVDPEWGMAARGVTLIEIEGVTHVLDHVGSEHYPNVADFVEETRRYGASRRAQKSLEFAKLTPESRLLLSHSLAGVVNMRDYPDWTCPKDNPEHTREALPFGQTCAGVWWRDIEGGEPVEGDTPGLVYREMPSFGYLAHRRPRTVRAVYYEALFLSLPLTRIAVVRDDEDAHLDALEAASAAQLPVEEVDE